MLLTLLLASAATFFVLEAAISAVPWSIPEWLQPLLVLAVATGFSYPDFDPRFAVATAGVAVLWHAVFLRLRPGQREVVRLNPGVGGRVPSLP